MKKSIKKKWKTGWWFSANVENNNMPHWERYITPYLSVIPWHKSVLASIPKFADTWSITCQIGWWTWRLSCTIGYTEMNPSCV